MTIFRSETIHLRLISKIAQNVHKFLSLGRVLPVFGGIDAAKNFSARSIAQAQKSHKKFNTELIYVCHDLLSDQALNLLVSWELKLLYTSGQQILNPFLIDEFLKILMRGKPGQSP